MVATVSEQLSEGRVFFIGNRVTADLQMPEGRVFTIYNIPAVAEEMSQGYIFAVTRVNGPQEISQARQMAIVRGRIAQPRLRAWTFTLDGHDFYVLRLGDYSTIVYDVYSEQWIEWTSPELSFWRANLGWTWLGGQALAVDYGSSIVVGDDTFGLLWFLDPLLPYDQNPGDDRTPQELPFDRVVTGQVLARNRQYIPCYSLFLDGDNYGLTATDFTPQITLETSDDQGRTFDAQDTLDVVVDYQQNEPYAWLSLGQITSPGRIFRFTDNGVFARIDSLGMNEDGG